MPQVLGMWENFQGGHWGNKGPESAASNQYGGVNMVVTESGGIAPMSASRKLDIAGQQVGECYGMFWGWGADGQLYYLQRGMSTHVTFTTQATVFRVAPDPTQTVTQVEVGGVQGPVTYEPDWVGVGTNIYLTVYGDKTYKINTSTDAVTFHAGSYGNAPAGRAICMYGERMVVGGISDARFGVHPNRIVFSGDDTNNDITDITKWEALNYFDLGADGTLIVGLYPTRDHLIVVLADQQIYVVTGVLGATATARRVYGFHKGSGAVSSFVAADAAVDPDQQRLWMFDHTQRAPANLTGTQWTKVAGWGAPQSSRHATAVQEGTMAMVGGPDELIMYGVAAGLQAGAGTSSQKLGLVRVNGAWGLLQRDVIGLR